MTKLLDFPQAFLFDLDGVLLDTEHLHSKAWFLTAAHFGSKLDEKKLLELRGRRRLDCFNQINKWLDLKVDIEELKKIHHPISKKLLSKAHAMPDAENLIKWCLEKKLLIAIVSSSSLKSFKLKASPHPWLFNIKNKVLGDDPSLINGKPHPDPFLLAAKRLDVNPKKCWALEDSESGTKAAIEAGCQVWVLKDKRDKVNWEIKNPKTQPNFVSSLKTILNELNTIYINKVYLKQNQANR